MKRPLHEVVKERLAELNLNPFAAASRGDLERGFLNDILNGKKRSVRGDNLEKLARALGWTVGDILVAQGAPPHLGAEYVAAAVPVVGKAAAGVWIEAEEAATLPVIFGHSSVPADPRFPPSAQFDLVVEGDSLNKFAAPGDRLRCVDIAKANVEINDGDLAVVQRSRENLIETSVRRVRSLGDSCLLTSESTDPRWRGTWSPGDEGLAIIGRVLFAYRVP